MKTHHYHDTTGLPSDERKLAEEHAKSQEEMIFAYFKERKVALSPSDVWNNAKFKKYPLTSIRRAMSNLTRDEKLTKTIIQKNGIYGKPEYLWTLAK